MRQFLIRFLGVFICLALVPLQMSRSSAQTSDKVYRLGIIAPSAAPVQEIQAVVLPELARMGFVEGKNLTVTVHVGNQSDMPKLAQEMLATKPDVALASSMAAVRAILALSANLPVVMAFVGEDPVATGLAKSFSRPGGSITGLTNLSTELDGKRLSLLHEALPGLKRIAFLGVHPSRHVESIQELKRVAGTLGLEIQVFYPEHPNEYSAVFAQMTAARVEGLIVAAAPEHVRDAALLGKYSISANLPAMAEFGDAARNGLLIAYGPDSVKFRRRAANFVASILRGTPPGELPIEMPTFFEFVVNLNTAKMLGITLPLSLIARANEVIE